jgi:hypothetical protein
MDKLLSSRQCNSQKFEFSIPYSTVFLSQLCCLDSLLANGLKKILYNEVRGMCFQKVCFGNGVSSRSSEAELIEMVFHQETRLSMFGGLKGIANVPVESEICCEADWAFKF